MRDYQTAWLTAEGRDYRRSFYLRTRATGSQPLLDNPTREELLQAIKRHDPESVLEIGCGYGRLLSWLLGEVPLLEGCDVSTEMLELCPTDVKTFRWDICDSFPFDRCWDVVFCRGLFMYFNDEQMATAMQNVSAVTAKAVLVWEWPDVCVRMQRIREDDLFEFHHLDQKPE